MSELEKKVERWLTHENLRFEIQKGDENSFHYLVKHAGQYGIPIDIFEPASQLGILVIGSKVNMKNSQIARYLKMSEKEKEIFEKKVGDFCNSIYAIHKFHEEDGKRKIGVYLVMDKPEEIMQETLLEAIDKVSEMSEKTSKYLLKTF